MHWDKQTDVGQFFQGDVGLFFKLLQQAEKEDREATFESLLKKLPDNYFDKEKAKFWGKINAAINNAFVACLLDQNYQELRWKVLSLFEELLKNRTSHLIFVGSESARALLEDPLVKAMLEEQIFHMNIYTSHVIFQNTAYFYFARDFVKENKKHMSLKQKVQYCVWKKYNGYYVERFRWYRDYNYYYYKYSLEPKENVKYEIAAYPDSVFHNLRDNIRSYQNYSTHYGARGSLKSTIKGEPKDS